MTFFGMHLLTSEIFDVLAEHIADNVRSGGEVQLTTAQAELASRSGAMGLEISGHRLDMGTPQGYLETQLALGLNGPFADELKAIYKLMQSNTNC